MKHDYVSLANQYASQVVAGEVLACSYVKQACQRQLDDLGRIQDAAFPFTFSEKLASRICHFAELFPHIKGPKAGQLLHLEPWEVFILASVFGWIRKDTGKRRFRRVYIEVPRGNAKSTLSAIVGLYCMAADRESGAEVYSAATTRDQARIVFDVAQQMAKKTPGYRRRFGVMVPAHAITQPATVSIFKALAADSDKLDGLNVHLAIVDELHAHPNRGVYDVIKSGAGKRDQSLVWCITTAGNDKAGICYEVRGYAIKVLSRVVDDDSIFGIIYTIDEGDTKRNPPIPGDDWANPESWKKANPNFGISVMPDVLEQDCKTALETPSAVNNFLTKHLDVWVNADRLWLDIRKWQEGADPNLKLEDFKGERCFGALDLASKIDVAAAIQLFKRLIDGQWHYYFFQKLYLPEARIRESSNAQYEGWARAGHFNVTSGNVIDFDTIENDLKKWPEDFEVVSLAYDPFQATQLSTHMMAEGFPMVELGQTVKNMSDSMKQLEALVRSGRLHHDGSPVMEWMASNVVAHYDHKDNVFPNKENQENKIDGIVALIMAINRAMSDPETPEPRIYSL